MSNDPHWLAAVARQKAGKRAKIAPPASRMGYEHPLNGQRAVPGQARWLKRRVEIALEISKAPGFDGFCISRARARRWRTDRDLQRFVAGGYASIHRVKFGRASHKFLRLTRKGLALLPTPPPTRAAQPYAKRKQALAEFEQANSDTTALGVALYVTTQL